MKVNQALWSIEKLVKFKDKINLNPAWQRGPAWRDGRRVLLIDSILRNMDVPKIYLRRLQAGGMYDFEAVDGQQRLRAIWDFVAPPSATAKNHGFALRASPPLKSVEGIAIADAAYVGLSKTLRDRFDKFQVGVGEIVESTNDEITVLFARLQMGMPLNPAELRNANLGPMRNIIQLMTSSHEFFAATKIANDRTRHFDFASYAFAIAAGDGQRDMKSTDLQDLQNEFNHKPMEEITALSAKVGNALNVLAEVDQHAHYRINRKWIFVDLLWLIMKYQAAGKAIDTARFTDAYNLFEERRRKYTSSPDLLLNKRRKDARPLDRSMYDYLFAFRTEGAKAAGLQIRHKSIGRFFRNVEVK
ncbi:DUF262 domain-containing protein [Mesorhizobium sp.]|uniref:DUF262 domain-containing protein n=1 Tax=Mesorhizobium sp. TaxID=1871066 RepID=UPI00258AEAAC|nr:DUF262 domain-containing protein [Mesorhizobium sp.]